MRKGKRTHPVLSSRVELTTEVAVGDVQERAVDEAGDLDSVRGDEELHALDRTLGDAAGAVASLVAVRDGIALGGADLAQLLRCPDTEVCVDRQRMHKRGPESNSPSGALRNAVWQRDFSPSVVELQRL